MSEGNWQALGYAAAAPNKEVVRILGAENDGVTVAVGVLRQLAASNASAWDDPETWGPLNSINADVLSEGGVDVIGTIVQPAKRPLPRIET